MRARARLGLGALCAASVLGCSSSEVIVVNGIDVYENHWQQTLDDLGPLASVDLGCPLNHLGFTLIRRTGRAPTEVGVTGCGRGAVYVRPTRMQFIAGGGAYMVIEAWVMDRRTQTATASEAAAPQHSATPAPAAAGLELGDE